jgi:hypothetical protein
MNNWNRIKSALKISKSRETIAATCDDIKELLLEKNLRYGNSALEPMRIFSAAAPDEALLVRIDDKLSRVNQGAEIRRNDVVDLIGYLVLYMVARGWNAKDLVD